MLDHDVEKRVAPVDADAEQQFGCTPAKARIDEVIGLKLDGGEVYPSQQLDWQKDPKELRAIAPDRSEGTTLLPRAEASRQILWL